MVFITIVTGAYKPTYNWGASHCIHTNHSQTHIQKYKQAGAVQKRRGNLNEYDTILSYVSSAKLREYAMEGLTNLGPFAEAKAVALRKCGSVRRIPIVQVQKT